MEDLNKRELNAQKDDSEALLDQRKSEATSDKTLRDLEENETDSSSTDTGGFDPGPSPDGALDESDEIKDAGPI
jgi:hypothetical protein